MKWRRENCDTIFLQKCIIIYLLSAYRTSLKWGRKTVGDYIPPKIIIHYPTVYTGHIQQWDETHIFVQKTVAQILQHNYYCLDHVHYKYKVKSAMMERQQRWQNAGQVLHSTWCCMKPANSSRSNIRVCSESSCASKSDKAVRCKYERFLLWEASIYKQENSCHSQIVAFLE